MRVTSSAIRRNDWTLAQVFVAVGAFVGCAEPASDPAFPVTELDSGGVDARTPRPRDASVVVDAASDSSTLTEEQRAYEEAKKRFVSAEANPGEWTWIDVPGALCRDGSATGVLVRLRQNSPGLVIYLDGGGACFSEGSCASNPSFADETETRKDVDSGILTRGFFGDGVSNPVRSWSMVYVPYCTGDFHMGNRIGDVPGVVTNQRFVGYNNLGFVLDFVQPYFAGENVNQVLLTGVSAGGFGALFNYDRVAERFGEIPVVLLDDAGPMFETGPVFTSCLENEWVDTFGFASTMPADCTDCLPTQTNGQLANLHNYLGNKYPNRDLAVLCSGGDAILRFFYGFGLNDCMTAGAVEFFPFALTLISLRENVLKTTKPWSSYLSDGSGHGHLIFEDQYSTNSVSGTTVEQWLADLLQGKGSHLAPPPEN